MLTRNADFGGNLVKPLARKHQIITEQLAGECVVYDAQSKKAYNLNSTVTWIWQHCNGATSVEEMASRFQQDFACDDSLGLVLSGVHQLKAADLLVSSSVEDSSEMPLGERKMSRRSVVAAGSALAPVIASILVPTAQAAKSGKEPKEPKGPKLPKVGKK